MTRIQWDQNGERRYETGVSHGVLYLPNTQGVYDRGFGWNGLVSVTESPSGAEPNPQYADNIKYLNLISAEDYAATIEAFTYPLEFEQCDGSAAPVPGIAVGQQPRTTFGLSYRTLVGNDLQATAFGYKLHLVYGALAAPTEKAYQTVNDSPEAITFSWELSTTAVDVPGYGPTATLTFDSTRVNAAALKNLEDILYGTAGTEPRLPTPAEAIALFAGTVTTVRPAAPTRSANTITIPNTTGVQYVLDGVVVNAGTRTVTGDKVVTARLLPGYVLQANSVTAWALPAA